jgi:hypothetical protein
MLNENLGDILGDTQVLNGQYLNVKWMLTKHKMFMVGRCKS